MKVFKRTRAPNRKALDTLSTQLPGLQKVEIVKFVVAVIRSILSDIKSDCVSAWPTFAKWMQGIYPMQSNAIKHIEKFSNVDDLISH